MSERYWCPKCGKGIVGAGWEVVHGIDGERVMATFECDRCGMKPMTTTYLQAVTDEEWKAEISP